MGRTSQSHPLRIDQVTLESGGRIGMTICPGKKQTDALTGRWKRDLSLDLAAIVAWRARALVSLMEDHEFVELEVANLGRRAMDMGLAWHHLPIADRFTPGEAFESRWRQSGPLLRELLQQGEGIVIHCKGGLGRTGMIAARLMVELGQRAEDAILQVRKARPGAIETCEQEAHVRRLKPS